MTTADQKQDIFYLAREGPYTPLKNLIDVDPKTELSKRDDDGRTVLHWACSFNKRTGLAKQLLTEYVAHLNVNATDSMNWTPLHIAVSW
jgi:ankyrin repeat protein